MGHPGECTCDGCLLLRMRSPLPGERRDGWAAWYQRDAQALLASIERRCSLLRCRGYGEDLLQDCFLIAFRNVAQGAYRDQGKGLKAYIAGIARNRLRELRRLHKHECSADDETENVRDQSLDLHSRACVTEVVRLVREGRTLRPALHQRVVTGIYVEGKSSDQLAAELGIRPGNVRAIAYRTVHEIGCHVRQQHKLQLTAAAIRACLEML